MELKRIDGALLLVVKLKAQGRVKCERLFRGENGQATCGSTFGFKVQLWEAGRRC